MADSQPQTPEASTTPPGSRNASIPRPVKDPKRKTHTSTSPINVFPEFKNGDILISSGVGLTWRVHSTTLCNASPKFKKLIEGCEPRKLSTKHKEEGKTLRWRLDMRKVYEGGDERFREFEISTYASKKQPAFKLPSLGVANDIPFTRIYDNLFRILYSINPRFTSSSRDYGAYTILDAISLLHAAESLSMVPAIRLVIESRLLSLSQMLWYHIENKPEAWADIAVRLQSPSIFREAMLHIVGKWDLRSGNGEGFRNVNRKFIREQENGGKVFQLAERKARELKDKKLLVERCLMEYYPKKMMHSEDTTHIPGRAIYSTDIYLWQGLVLVRQYLSSCMLSNMHHRCFDGGAAFYRCIGAGGDAYLRSDTLDRFHLSFGMSTKGKQCLQAAVEFHKSSLAPIVKKLLVDRTQVNRKAKGGEEQGLPYLTCTEILDEELPWWDGEKLGRSVASERDGEGDMVME